MGRRSGVHPSGHSSPSPYVTLVRDDGLRLTRELRPFDFPGGDRDSLRAGGHVPQRNGGAATGALLDMFTAPLAMSLPANGPSGTGEPRDRPLERGDLDLGGGANSSTNALDGQHKKQGLHPRSPSPAAATPPAWVTDMAPQSLMPGTDTDLQVQTCRADGVVLQTPFCRTATLRPRCPYLLALLFIQDLAETW